MATGVATCHASMDIDMALELMVQNELSRLPVVDPAGRIIGILTAFDLLALTGVGPREREEGLFPPTTHGWETHREVEMLLRKHQGETRVPI